MRSTAVELRRCLEGPVSSLVAETDVIVNTMTLLLGWLVTLALPRLLRVDIHNILIGRWPALAAVVKYIELHPVGKSIAATIGETPPLPRIDFLKPENSFVSQAFRMVYFVAGVHILLSLLTALRAYRCLRYFYVTCGLYFSPGNR